MGVLAIPLIVAGTGLAVVAGRQAAGAQTAELEGVKRQEAAGARDREVQRKRRTVAILGAQAASAAAKGVQLAGSVANISLVDAKRAGEESLVDEINTRERIDALSRRQRSIRRVANIRGVSTIIRGGERIAARG